MPTPRSCAFLRHFGSLTRANAPRTKTRATTTKLAPSTAPPFTKPHRGIASCGICLERAHRTFASMKSKPRSPYAVLRLRTSASKDEIKSAFRRLAKKYHPDVNPTRPRKESEGLMAELIDAYDHLMDDDFAGRVGDSRVALACEMYTIAELRMDRLHDVYSLKVSLVDDDGNDVEQAKGAIYATAPSQTNAEVSTDPLIEIEAHQHDSVSDVKRRIQSQFLNEWDLKNRRLDRDGIATGWEVVTDTDGSVLSYHLFLSSYGIKNGDIIHAVVRKYNEMEREVSSQS